MAANNLRQYAFIPEVTFGTTPATPQTQIFEVSSFDLDPQAETLTDPSIRADRQVGFNRRGNLAASGNMEVALAPDNYDLFLQATLGGTWTTNVLKVGNTARSFAIEEGFTDDAKYRTFNGVTFNSLSLEVTPEDLVKATFGVMGSGATAFSGTSIDTTPTALTAKPKYFHEGAVITEGGSAIALVSGIKLDITNNITGNYALGSTAYRSMSLGKIEVTGTLTAYFESTTLFDKFTSATESSLSFTLTAGSPAETLQFNIPKLSYTQGKITRGDTGAVLVEMTFRGAFDTSSASTLVITRSA